MADDVKAGLAGLAASSSSVEVEAALNALDAALSTARGMKLLSAKDARKKVTSFACASLTRTSHAAATTTLRILLALAQSSRVTSRAIYSEVGMKPLVSVLRRSGSPPEACTSACELLLLMARHTKKFALTMRLDGGLDALCLLLAGNPEHSVLRPVCATLQKCCDGNELSIRTVHKKGTVRHLFAMLHARLSSGAVCAPIFSLLATLTDGSKFRAVIENGDPESHALIVAVLKRHVDDPAVAVAGLSLLHAISSDLESAAKLCAAGAFTAAWSAVVRHVGTAAVGRQAMATIWRLVAVLSPRTPGTGAGAGSGTAAGGAAAAGDGMSASTLAAANSVVASVADAYAMLDTGSGALGSSVALRGSTDVATAGAGAGTSSGAQTASVPAAGVGLDPRGLLSIVRLTAGRAAAAAGPATTLTQWPLPHRYLNAQVANPMELAVLPRWAGHYVARPGWYPPLPCAPVRLRIAFAVPRAKAVRAALHAATASGSGTAVGRAAAVAPRRTLVPPPGGARASMTGGAAPATTLAGDAGAHADASAWGGATDADAGVSPDDSDDDDDLASAISFFGVKSSASLTSALSIAPPPAPSDSTSGYADMQSQLRLQISAILDDEGFFRHKTPAHAKLLASAAAGDAATTCESVAAASAELPAATPGHVSSTPTGTPSVLSAASPSLRAPRVSSGGAFRASRSVSATTPGASGMPPTFDDEGSIATASAATAAGAGGVGSSVYASYTAAQDAASRPTASWSPIRPARVGSVLPSLAGSMPPASTLTQLIDSRVEVGTVSLLGGAMGVSLSMAARGARASSLSLPSAGAGLILPNGSSPFASTPSHVSANGEAAFSLQALDAGGSDSARLSTRRLQHTQSMSELPCTPVLGGVAAAAGGATSGSPAALPTLVDRSLRRHHSRADLRPAGVTSSLLESTDVWGSTTASPSIGQGSGALGSADGFSEARRSAASRGAVRSPPALRTVSGGSGSIPLASGDGATVGCDTGSAPDAGNGDDMHLPRTASVTSPFAATRVAHTASRRLAEDAAPAASVLDADVLVHLDSAVASTDADARAGGSASLPRVNSEPGDASSVDSVVPGVQTGAPNRPPRQPPRPYTATSASTPRSSPSMGSPVPSRPPSAQELRGADDALRPHMLGASALPATSPSGSAVTLPHIARAGKLRVSADVAAARCAEGQVVGGGGAPSGGDDGVVAASASRPPLGPPTAFASTATSGSGGSNSGAPSSVPAAGGGTKAQQQQQQQQQQQRAGAAPSSLSTGAGVPGAPSVCGANPSPHAFGAPQRPSEAGRLATSPTHRRPVTSAAATRGARSNSTAFVVTFDPTPGSAASAASTYLPPSVLNNGASAGGGSGAAAWQPPVPAGSACSDFLFNGEKPVLRRSAFESLRAWLSFPHWYPELQNTAAVLWELAPFRALLWRSMQVQLKAVAPTEQGLEPAPDEEFNLAVHAHLAAILKQLRPPGGADTMQVAPTTLAGNKATGFYFPARAVTATTGDAVHVEGEAATARKLHMVSLAFIRAFAANPKYGMDERRILDRRLPSFPVDAAEGVTGVIRGALTEAAAGRTLQPRLRSSRVHVSPTGMCSVRRMVVPPHNTPSAFHAAPPCGRIIGLSPSSVGPVPWHTHPELHSLSLIPATSVLVGGYGLLARVPLLPPANAATSHALHKWERPSMSELADLPEPLMLTSAEQRSAIIGRTMLQTIARAGVAAGQLMRHRFTGEASGAAEAASVATTAPASGSGAPAPALVDTLEVVDPSARVLAELLSSAQCTTVFHRYADLEKGDTPAAHTGILARVQPTPALPGSSTAPVACGLANFTPSDILVVAYPFEKEEARAPALRLPNRDLGVVVPLDAESDDEDDGDNDSAELFHSVMLPRAHRPAVASTLYDNMPVADALALALPPQDPAEEAAAGVDEGDDDSQGSDEDGDAPVVADVGGDDGADDADVDAGEAAEAAADERAAGTDGAAAGSLAKPVAAGAHPMFQTALLRAARLHAQRVRESLVPTTLSKRDVMRVLSEAADEVQAMVIASSGGATSKLADIAAKCREARAAASGVPVSDVPANVGGAATVATSVGSRVKAMASIPPLTFESRFETGNLCSANRVSPFEYELTLDADINTTGHTQWFYFRVRNMVAEDGSCCTIAPDGSIVTRQVLPRTNKCGVDGPASGGGGSGTGSVGASSAADAGGGGGAYRLLDTSNEPLALQYKFHVVNLEKGGSSFNEGMRPLVYYQCAEDTPPSSAEDASSGVNAPDSAGLRHAHEALASAAVHGKPKIDVALYMPPASSLQSMHVPVLPGEGWRRATFDIVYYRNQYSRVKLKQGAPTFFDDVDDATSTTGGVRAGAIPHGTVPVSTPQYSETWSISFPAGVHTVFFAYCYPYTYTDLRRDVVRWERRSLRLGALALPPEARLAAAGTREFGDVVEEISSPSLCEASGHAPTPAVATAGQVAIQEFDAVCALGSVDGLIKDVALPSAARLVGTPWLQPSMPFSVRPGLGGRADQPLGTLFASQYLHRTNLCHSVAGNPLPLLTITDFTSPPAAVACRPYVLLSGRVHPGETNGSWMLRGVIDFLTSSAPVAAELRKRVIFKVVPFLNPDGVINGHHRTNLAGFDLNRHWTTPDLAKAPTIWHLRQLILQLQARAAACAMLTEALGNSPLAMEDLGLTDTQAYIAQLLADASAEAAAGRDISLSSPMPSNVHIMPPVPQPVLLYVDFHGHSRRQDIFTFGCHEFAHDGGPATPGDMPTDANPPINPSSRLFPRLLAARADTFTYKGCSWKVQREKYNCARVATWRDASLTAAYTIEATFSGATAGCRRGTHLNTVHLEEMGHAFCLALLDWLEAPRGARHADAMATLQRIALAQAAQASAHGLGAATDAAVSASASAVDGAKAPPPVLASGGEPEAGAARRSPGPATSAPSAAPAPKKKKKVAAGGASKSKGSSAAKVK